MTSATTQAAGGQVLALGRRPVNSTDAFPDAALTALAEAWTLVPDEAAKDVPKLVARHHPPAIVAASGPKGVLRFTHRRTASGEAVHLVANDADRPWSGTVRVQGDPLVRIWNPRNGRVEPAQGEIALELPAYGAVVLTAISKKQ